MVSAWSSEHQLVIGHVTVDRVSNEIKAVPVLLEQLDLEGTLVSLDAMGGVSYQVALRRFQNRSRESGWKLK